MTGCDANSGFYGKGKKSVYDPVAKSPVAQQQLSRCGDSLDLPVVHQTIADTAQMVQRYLTTIHGIPAQIHGIPCADGSAIPDNDTWHPSPSSHDMSYIWRQEAHQGRVPCSEVEDTEEQIICPSPSRCK